MSSLSLQSIARTQPWLILGDFNAVLGAHERMGGRSPNPTSCSNFANMIAMINLQEIESKGASFTWARDGYMECKLDRALYNIGWLEFWVITNYCTLPRRTSDHNPIVVSFNSEL